LIHEHLYTGAENALTGKTLCQALGINARELTAAIERERREGQPICASTGDPPGYYLAASRDEMERYCRSLYHRAGEIHRTRNACLKTLDSLPVSRGHILQLRNDDVAGE